MCYAETKHFTETPKNDSKNSLRFHIQASCVEAAKVVRLSVRSIIHLQ